MRKSFITSYALVFLLGLSFLWPTINEYLEPNPYDSVKEVSVMWNEDYVDIKYSFFKNEDCQILQFAVVGIGILPDYLEYTDLNNTPQDEELYNREAGLQGLHLRVFTEDFDKIEIRTAHNCSGVRIEKLFTTLERNNLHDENLG